MSMRDAILNFPKQFEYESKIENLDKYKPGKKFIVCGMGGSHLAAMILQTVKSETDLVIHRDYGLPAHLDGDELIVLSSYSGNTEEVIDGFHEALGKKLPMIAISIGGKLIELAKSNSIPYIQMSDMKVQPRSALGLSFKALLAAIGEEMPDVTLRAEDFEAEGKTLAQKTKGHVTVIYSSTRNLSLAYNWKIKLNETGKIPAFYNVLPELNHNEMTGFDVVPSTKALSDKFHFIFLQDSEDGVRVQKRMQILEKLYRDRGLPVETIMLEGDPLQKVFSCLLIADWFALYTAENYGVESEQVPMVEEFKKLIAQ